MDFNNFAATSSGESSSTTLQDISHAIHKIVQLENELETLNQNILISGSSTVKSDLLSCKEKDIVQLIKSTCDMFAALAGQTISEQITRIHTERLKADLKRAIQRFQRIQVEIKRRIVAERRRPEPATSDLLGLETEIAAGSVEQGNQLKQQSMLTGRVDVDELGHTLRKEEEMQALESDIADVNSIFQQLSALVYDQRAAIDSIEDNLQAAYVNQEDGTAQLHKAAACRQRSRKRCCICSIVLIVIVAIVIFVLIIMYGPSWKR